MEKLAVTLAGAVVGRRTFFFYLLLSFHFHSSCLCGTTLAVSWFICAAAKRAIARTNFVCLHHNFPSVCLSAAPFISLSVCLYFLSLCICVCFSTRCCCFCASRLLVGSSVRRKMWRRGSKEAPAVAAACLGCTCQEKNLRYNVKSSRQQTTLIQFTFGNSLDKTRKPAKYFDIYKILFATEKFDREKMLCNEGIIFGSNIDDNGSRGLWISYHLSSLIPPNSDDSTRSFQTNCLSRTTLWLNMESYIGIGGWKSSDSDDSRGLWSEKFLNPFFSFSLARPQEPAAGLLGREGLELGWKAFRERKNPTKIAMEKGLSNILLQYHSDRREEGGRGLGLSMSNALQVRINVQLTT